MTSPSSSHLSAPAGDGAAPPAGVRDATVALVLALAGILLGFLLVPLLASVVAVTMGSLGLQAASDGRADPAAVRRLHTAIACGVVGLALWIPVAVAAAVMRS